MKKKLLRQGFALPAVVRASVMVVGATCLSTGAQAVTDPYPKPAPYTPPATSSINYSQRDWPYEPISTLAPSSLLANPTLLWFTIGANSYAQRDAYQWAISPFGHKPSWLSDNSVLGDHDYDNVDEYGNPSIYSSLSADQKSKSQQDWTDTGTTMTGQDPTAICNIIPMKNADTGEVRYRVYQWGNWGYNWDPGWDNLMAYQAITGAVPTDTAQYGPTSGSFWYPPRDIEANLKISGITLGADDTRSISLDAHNYCMNSIYINPILDPATLPVDTFSDKNGDAMTITMQVGQCKDVDASNPGRVYDAYMSDRSNPYGLMMVFSYDGQTTYGEIPHYISSWPSVVPSVHATYTQYCPGQLTKASINTAVLYGDGSSDSDSAMALRLVTVNNGQQWDDGHDLNDQHNSPLGFIQHAGYQNALYNPIDIVVADANPTDIAPLNVLATSEIATVGNDRYNTPEVEFQKLFAIRLSQKAIPAGADTINYTVQLLSNSKPGDTTPQSGSGTVNVLTSQDGTATIGKDTVIAVAVQDDPEIGQTGFDVVAIADVHYLKNGSEIGTSRLISRRTPFVVQRVICMTSPANANGCQE